MLLYLIYFTLLIIKAFTTNKCLFMLHPIPLRRRGTITWRLALSLSPFHRTMTSRFTVVPLKRTVATYSITLTLMRVLGKVAQQDKAKDHVRNPFATHYEVTNTQRQSIMLSAWFNNPSLSRKVKRQMPIFPGREVICKR